MVRKATAAAVALLAVGFAGAYVLSRRIKAYSQVPFGSASHNIYSDGQYYYDYDLFGNLVFGGPSSAGGVAGSDAGVVAQAALNLIKSGYQRNKSEGTSLASSSGLFNFASTLNIPALQDAIINFGESVWNYQGLSGDGIVIDSTENCNYNLGTVVSGSAGAAVRIKPANPTPIDNLVIFTETRVNYASIASSNLSIPPISGSRGLVLDISGGTIAYCGSRNDPYIKGDAILGFDLGVELTPALGSGPVQAYNGINVAHLHGNNLMAKVGPNALQNYFSFNIAPDTIVGATGLDTSGNNNFYDLIMAIPLYNPGRDVVFESPASNEYVQVLGALPDGYTDLSVAKNNRVVLI